MNLLFVEGWRQGGLNRIVAPSCFRDELGEGDAGTRAALNTTLQNGNTVSFCEYLQKISKVRLARNRSCVNDRASADGDYGRELADDEPVAGHEESSGRKLKAGKRFFPGCEFLRIVQGDFGHGLHCVGVEVD